MKSAEVGTWQTDLGGAVVCLALLGAAYAGVIAPGLARHQRQHLDELRLANLQHTAGAAAVSARAAGEEWKLVEQQIQHDAVQLRPAGEVNRQLAQITTAASAAGLDLQGCRVGQAVAGSGYTMLPIHLEGRAAFPQVLRFLHQLGSACPAVSCASVRLGDAADAPPGNGSGAAALVRVELELRWFALPDAAPVNGVVATAGQ